MALLTPRRVAIAAVALVALGAVGWFFFAPKPEIQREDAAPEPRMVLRVGEWQDGEPLHHASGIVRLLQLAEGRHVLRFEGYDATPGPDVYFYLTPKVRASTTAEVEGEGLRVPTGAMMGQATWRGDFNVDVPAGADLSSFGGIVAWCDRYNVLFGWAELAPP